MAKKKLAQPARFRVDLKPKARFRVIKASIDGVCGGDSLLTIDEACREIAFWRGWSCLDDLHLAMRRWAAIAKPGDVFKTPASAIVCAKGGA